MMPPFMAASFLSTDILNLAFFALQSQKSTVSNKKG